MTIKISNRLQKLRQKLTEREIEAILISQPENRYYLSGFSGSAGYLLITSKDATLATDFRYIEQAQAQAPDYNIFQISGNIGDWFHKLIARLRVRKLGFEARHITFAEYHQFNDILDEAESQVRLVPEEELVESLRTIKDAEETELITRAAQIADSASDHIHNIASPGMTEKDVAWEIERFMRDQGSEPMPFDIIVASGPNSALPHAKPSKRVIQAGEPIVIDIGARCGGYCSDLSRTICLSTPDETFNKVYDTVLKAQLAAITGIDAGMTGEQADGLAREVIEQAGYGKAFGHSLGHGVGLAPHEQPRLSPKSSEQLANGMVFTIEPGIYLSGWGGVRIEDLAVMEESKARIISKARKIRT